jgi:putative membrane protein
VSRPGDPDAVDPSLAGERTDLAWNRSGLALLACGAAVARGLGIGEPVPERLAVGVTILVLGAVTWALGAWQARRRSRPGRPRQVARPADLLPISLGTAAVGIAALVLGLFFPS